MVDNYDLDDKTLLERVIGDDSITFMVHNKICNSLSKMLDIFEFKGCEIDRYIDNYYNYEDNFNSELSFGTLFFKFYDDVGNEIDKVKNISFSQTNKDEFYDIMSFFERHGLIIDTVSNDPKIKYDSMISATMNYDNIIKNSHIAVLLKTGIRTFFVESTVSQRSIYQNADYTFLMLNFVKSLERFMFYKLNKLNLIKKGREHEDTFWDLQNNISKYIENELDDIPVLLKEHYLYLLNKTRESYRNGYFHRDICDKKTAFKTIEITIILIILTEFIFDID